MKPKCHLQVYNVKCVGWRNGDVKGLHYIIIFDNAALRKCLNMFTKPAFIWSKTEKNCSLILWNIISIKKKKSILIYIYTILIKYNLFLWFKAGFSASLLHSSMHGPSDIILICWFIINVGNSCAAYFFIGTCDLGSLINKKFKRTVFIQNRDVFYFCYHCF